MEDAKKDECIARYSGELLNREHCEALSIAERDYIVAVHRNLYLDAKDVRHWEGRYINDGSISGKKSNARFQANYKCQTCPITGHKWIYVYVKRNMKAGEEIFISYKGKYWQQRRGAREMCDKDGRADKPHVAQYHNTTEEHTVV